MTRDRSAGWAEIAPAGVREAISLVLADLSDVQWELPTQISEGNLLLVEWAAESASTRVSDGVDTLIFSDDGIRVQTVRFTPRRIA